MTVHQFGTFDAKNKLSKLLDLVEQGDEVVITRNGKPVARMVPDYHPETEEARLCKAKEAVERIKALRDSLPKDTLKGTSIRELIEEGRRY